MRKVIGLIIENLRRSGSRSSFPGEELAVIVVAFNSTQIIERTVNELKLAAAFADFAARFVIVDNGAEQLNKVFSDDPLVQVITPEVNLGYSGAINVACSHLEGVDWVIIANPDIRVPLRAVKSLIQGCCDTDACSGVPRLVSEHRIERSLRREPSFSRMLGEAVFGDFWPSRPAWLSEIVRSRADYNHRHFIEWATGAFLAVRLSTLREVGPWDESFFLYSEETDFFRRVRALGGRNLYEPSATVLHSGGGSGSSLGLQLLLSLSRLRYYRKWNGPADSRIYFIALVCLHLLRILRADDRRILGGLLWRRRREQLLREIGVVESAGGFSARMKRIDGDKNFRQTRDA